MASDLTVQTIRGPGSGANANKVIVPTGQTLALSSGSTLDINSTTISGKIDYANIPVGGVVQVVTKRSLTLASVDTTTFTELHNDYRVGITPKFSNSRIYLRYVLPVNNVGGSTGTIMHVKAYKFTPSSADLTSYGGDFNGNLGNRTSCTAPYRPAGFDSNDPSTWMFEAYDQPGSTAYQEYGFLYKRETGGQNTTYFCHSSGNTTSYGWMAPIIIVATEIRQ